MGAGHREGLALAFSPRGTPHRQELVWNDDAQRHEEDDPAQFGGRFRPAKVAPWRKKGVSEKKLRKKGVRSLSLVFLLGELWFRAQVERHFFGSSCHHQTASRV